jgi:glucose/arabinose dehydrogenase
MFKQSASKVVAAAWLAAVAIFVGLTSSAAPQAQRGPAPTDTLGAGPWDLGAGRGRVHVTAIKGLDHPWGIAFVPDGSMLVTERPGRLRVVRNGVADPTPIGPGPQSLAVGLGGYLDVILDPQFATNRRIYLAFAKPGPGGGNDATTAVYRARWDGGSTLSEGKESGWRRITVLRHQLPGVLGPPRAPRPRVAWDPAGNLFVSLGDRNIGVRSAGSQLAHQQDRAHHNDGGAQGQPVCRQAGYKPEI